MHSFAYISSIWEIRNKIFKQDRFYCQWPIFWKQIKMTTNDLIEEEGRETILKSSIRISKWKQLGWFCAGAVTFKIPLSSLCISILHTTYIKWYSNQDNVKIKYPTLIRNILHNILLLSDFSDCLYRTVISESNLIFWQLEDILTTIITTYLYLSLKVQKKANSPRFSRFRKLI